ncbi:MAG: hypothetical protein COA45_09680 [Zetaproteobacteria bacterium]|nr:MAG: hypothetical protein COA45_09680 [Zetaproteobacteria bacterium]
MEYFDVMANQYLSLALFLMLLSFFIVMNAVSGFDESKATPVLSSLSMAFSSQILETAENVADEETPRVALGEGDALEVLEGLFSAHISGFQATRNRLGTVMHVRADVEAFENAIDVSGVGYDDVSMGERGSFILSMISILRSQEKGQTYRIDMILNLPKDPAVFQKNYPDEFMHNLKHVSGFAEILERAGLPKKMISAGVAKGDVGFIDLYFYRYRPFNMLAEISNKKRKSGAL